MKENREVQRVNYSLQKHHRELLHQQIDPRVIDSIELAQNPSLNYKKAFETVYYDELQRTLEEKQGKASRVNAQRQPAGKECLLPKIGHSSSYQTLQAYKPAFADYDEERNRKFDDLINRQLDGGGSFFRAQDEYQRRKEFERSMVANTLKQQLVINREMRTLSKQKENKEAEVLRANRARQMELENQRQMERKQEQLMLGAQIQQQMQYDHLKKARKSYFEHNNMIRHNPITNPIEYHIDNPYILRKFQDKVGN